MPSDATPSSNEAQAFAQRLRQALEQAGHAASPTVVAHEFNLRYWGRGISIHAARNWLLGVSLPRHDKLHVLADWLRVAPEALLLGAQSALPHTTDAAGTASYGRPASPAALGLADQHMLQTYLRLSRESQRTVQAVVAACKALDASQAAAPAASAGPTPASAQETRARRKP